MKQWIYQLLSPTYTALKSMIEICEQFSDDYKLQFNPDKSNPEVIMSDITDAPMVSHQC